MKMTGELQGWRYDPVYNIIWGFIFNDERRRFADGTWIHTSSLLTKRGEVELNEGDVVSTLNSVYLLGAPLSEWGNPDEE